MCPSSNPGPHGPDSRISPTGTVDWSARPQCGAPGAPVDLVQLAMVYQTGLGHVRYYDFHKETGRFARLHWTSEAYLNLFPFEDATDLTRRLRTSKYLMSSLESGYENRRYWRREVPFRRDVFVHQRVDLKSSDLPARDPLHPFLRANSNAYRHHFDVPMFKYLTPIQDDFKPAHGRNVHSQNQVLGAVIVDTALSLVTAEAVRFALQGALADEQYVHQHLGRLQANSGTSSLEIIDRYAHGPGVDELSAIIVAPRVSIADTPWWRADTRTGQFYHSNAAGTGSKEAYPWTTGRNDALSFQTTHQTDLWNPAIGQPSNLWDFFTNKLPMLGPGQFRGQAREHVLVFQYKSPVNSRPGDPNLPFINHRSGILIQKRALESDIRRHYTGDDSFKFMASVETLKEVLQVCRLQVDDSSTFVWGTDC